MTLNAPFSTFKTISTMTTHFGFQRAELRDVERKIVTVKYAKNDPQLLDRKFAVKSAIKNLDFYTRKTQ
jgi:hypothetical protein